MIASYAPLLEFPLRGLTTEEHQEWEQVLQACMESTACIAGAVVLLAVA
jgi:uncharacterized protein